MQDFIDQALMGFRNVFSRNASWLLFCAIILGMMCASEMIGVTSLCRFWLVNEAGYHRLLHFF